MNDTKKSLFAVFGFALLFQATAFAAPAFPQTEEEDVLIECSSVRARTHVYQVVSYQRRYYFDVLSQNGHHIQRILVGAPYIFGDTFIMTASKGPGGYVHLYQSGKISVIDINLVNNDEISTKQALTDFHCKQLD